MPKKQDRDSFRFEGFTFPNTTPVPDEFFDVVAPRLGEAELRVTLYIIRRTFGFKKQSDDVSISQLCKGIIKKDGTVLDEGTGLSKPAVTKAVKSLVKKGILISERRKSKERGDEPTTYSLNIRAPYPVLSSLTRGGYSSLHGGVNELNTQQTVLQQTDNNSGGDVDINNHHSSGEQSSKKQDVVASDATVVVALSKFGLSEKVASRLANRYSQRRVLEKIEYLEFLQTHNPEQVKKPAGWLRRAIEENFSEPDGFISRAQREAQAAEKEHKRQQQAQREALEEARWQEELERRQQERTPWDDLWDQSLAQIKSHTPTLVFATRYSLTKLKSLTDDGVALIQVPDQESLAWLTHQQEQGKDRFIKPVLANLGHPVSIIRFVLADNTNSENTRIEQNQNPIPPP